MKYIMIIAIVIAGVIGAVIVFASIPSSTSFDNRPSYPGDTKPDEIS